MIGESATIAGMSLLEKLRAGRGFDAHEVAETKIGRLATWFAREQLDTAVVGVSGGVDSAVVLALLSRAKLRRVVGLAMPIAGRGATNQTRALERARLAAKACGGELWEVPLGDALAHTIGALVRASGLVFDAWAEGQTLSVVRTPALYGAVALLRAHGHRAVVVGTTNRDEGAYLGFFGKASDGMVDVQLISDLHKSEVRALARELGIPAELIEAEPAGDVHDGRPDEEMIGATYDEIETVLRLRELGYAPVHPAIEKQHAANLHKYAAGHPAVHLDVLPRGVPGGWPDEPLAGRAETRPPPGAIPGAWDPPEIALDPIDASRPLPAFARLPVPHGLAIGCSGVLTVDDCVRLRAALSTAPVEPVGVSGIRDSYGIGSVRATAWSPALAAALFARLRPVVPAVRFLGPMDPTDARGHRTWRLVGVSPVLRFMRYEAGGRHLCHYDAAYDYGDGRRTLLSVVWFLTDAPRGGATRFVRDGQESLPTAERDFRDWSRDTTDDEVILAVQPAIGSAVIFDHRLCHDVERWDGPGDRAIIRGDVVYEAIDDGRT